MTLLALDVGNTRLKWALYETFQPEAPLLAQGAEFLENIEKLADGPWSTLPQPQRMLGCIVAGDAVKRRVQEQMEIWDIAPQWVVSSAAEIRAISACSAFGGRRSGVVSRTSLAKLTCDSAIPVVRSWMYF